MYQAFERHCRVATGGYSSLSSVLVDPPPLRYSGYFYLF
jgi:hypothetical protein